MQRLLTATTAAAPCAGGVVGAELPKDRIHGDAKNQTASTRFAQSCRRF